MKYNGPRARGIPGQWSLRKEGSRLARANTHSGGNDSYYAVEDRKNKERKEEEEEEEGRKDEVKSLKSDE